MLTQEQITAMVAAGIPAEQIAAMMGAGAAPAKRDSILNSLKTAADPKDRNQTLSHPEKTPLENGRGRFDGTYALTVRTIGFEGTKKGQILKNVFTVDESTNPLVMVGGTREHPLFQWVDAAVSETKGFLQTLYEATGHQGSWVDDDAWYYAATGEQNSCAGLRFKLTVYTEPQRNNSNLFFSKHKYEQMVTGQVLGLVASATPVAPSQGLAPLPAPAVPPSVPGGSAYAGAPAAAPAPAVVPAGLPSTPPANWPKTVRWPGESDAQFAARQAAP